ncbi:LuxR C-terminal-related transcriptional regulator [Streptomyces sp. NPDC001089]
MSGAELVVAARDVAIVTAYAQGHSARHIADELGVSERAVYTRTQRLANRLGIVGAQKPALVDYLYRHGYIAVGELRALPYLPPRKVEILKCAARGLGYRQTAAELGIAANTASNHRQALLELLQVQSTAHAVALAWEAGLLTEVCTTIREGK